METRLDLLRKDLVKRLSLLSPLKLRRIAYKVCELALRCNKIATPLIERFRLSFDDRSIEDIIQLRTEILGFVNELDEIQWSLRDQLDMKEVDSQTYLQAFYEARTFNALYFALDPNPYVAAAESIYEAHAATNNIQAIVDMVEEVEET